MDVMAQLLSSWPPPQIGMMVTSIGFAMPTEGELPWQPLTDEAERSRVAPSIHGIDGP